jgi:hypothetical protein
MAVKAGRLTDGPDYHASHIDEDRKTRNLRRQLKALGYTVTLQAAA